MATALNPGRRHDFTIAVQPSSSSHNIAPIVTIAFLASVFELTGENKRNLINVLM